MARFRFVSRIAAAALMIAPTSAALSQAPDSWDGLVKVPSKRADAAYLLPGADFRVYTKVQLDPPEVAFRKNWLRDYNRSAAFSQRMNDSDANKMLEEGRESFAKIFAKAFTDAGYQLVSEAGPDVLRLRTGVINVSVSAPDVMSAGRSRSYSEDAGEATLVIEVRDSTSGALLGRALDRRTVGDNLVYRRTSVSNRADFEQVFARWAKASVEGLNNLRSLPPVVADNR